MRQKAIPLAVMSSNENSAMVAELARSYGSRVLHASFRILGDHAMAQDVQQDVFLRLLHRIPEAVEQWPAYLTTMATRLSIDRLRSKQRKTRLLALLGRREPPPTPEDEMQRAELAPALRKSLARLSHRESEAFCLRYLCDLDISEVALSLKLTENNVSVALHRARRKLADLLALSFKEETSP